MTAWPPRRPVARGRSLALRAPRALCTLGAWSALLALASLASSTPARAQGGGPPGGAPPGDGQPGERPEPPTGPPPGPPVDPAELERRVFGADRKARSKAAWKAMHQGAFPEEVWIRLLEHRFASRDEDEEAKYLAAYALARAGTERCLPQLEALLRDPPQVLVERETARGTSLGPAYGYQSEAALGINLIRQHAVNRRLNAQLAPLTPEAQAERLMELWVEGDAGYFSFRSPQNPEAVPPLWRGSLVARLRQLKATGAWAMARGLESLESDALRDELCNELYGRFASRPTEDAAKRDPEIDRLLRYGGPEGLLKARRRALDPELREPVRAAVRAVLARPLGEEYFGMENILPRAVVAFELTDLEPEIMQALLKVDWATTPRFAKGLAGCLDFFARLGSDRSLDFMVAHRIGRREVPLARWVPRCLDALEREQERPETRYFRWLTVQCGGNLDLARHVDAARLEAVLARVRQIHAELPPGFGKSLVGTRRVPELERVLGNVHQAQGGRRD